MKNQLILAVATLAICFGSISCSDDDGRFNPEPIFSLTKEEYDIVKNCNDFGFDLLKKALNSSESANTNFILSPIEVNQVYCMVANGADEATRSMITKALGYQSLDIKQVNELNKIITDRLKVADNSASLFTANSLWTTSEITLADGFTSAAQSYYGTNFNIINKSTFVSDINSWCKEKTDGAIVEFMNETEGVPDILAGNVVSISGRWSQADRFDASKTTDGFFKDENGNVSSVRFMRNKKDMLYYETETLQKCALRCGSSSYIAFILPKDGVTLSEAIDALAEGEWAIIWPYDNSVVVDLSLPIFKIEQEIDLQQLLPDFNIADILGHPSKTSVARQKTALTVNERNAPINPGFIPDINTSSDKEVTMTFDRPFIYVVYEQSTTAVLLAGYVNTFAN